ncbi:MAG: sodium:solute symporter family protein [Spirochaetaceae bacterium]|jgi:SSS family solute:Na+ symporter|nr:sodium:solute symporter family protein [Spirochaetaceae bacterium]
MNYFAMITITILYLATIAWLGYKGYSKGQSSKDYLLAGRNTHPFVMAMSYGATFISTSAIVGFGGISALFGMSLLWLSMCNVLVGIFIAFVFLGKRTRKMGLTMDAHTFPEFLGRRLDSRFIQIFAGGTIFIFMPLYTAAVLIGAARIIESFLGVPFEISVLVFSILVGAYVIFGGLKSVMYTDALQGTLMFLGMLILLIFTYSKLGGIVQAHRSLSDLAYLIPDSIKGGGITSWTASPTGGSPMWWVVYSSLVLGVGIGVLAQPQLVVRFMTVRSNKELNRAVAIGGLFILMTVGATFMIGPLTNLYFQQTEGAISIALAQGNPDKVIPMYINSAMPSWFVTVFMLVILSAAMSTLSSQFHTIGTSISRDILEKGFLHKKDFKENRVVLLTRIGIVLSLLVTILLSLKISSAGIIARATAIFFGLMASCFLAPYVLGLYWKGLTRKGAIAGILVGLGFTAFGFLFLHGKESAMFGLCEAIFGRPSLLGGMWTVVDPMVYALPLSIIATLLVSLVTKVENKEKVESFFKKL